MIHNIDCREGLKTLSDNSVDSIVTDPPYELGFCGAKWDKTGIAYDVDMWRECLRVLKPGGHLLSFSSARTYHRMTVAIEDAGFDIRDQIMWVYGSGFPKHKTHLKPSHEPICVARKAGKSHGFNIEGCRVGESGGTQWISKGNKGDIGQFGGGIKDGGVLSIDKGRYPANFIHDGLEEVWSKYFYCPKASKADKGIGNFHNTVKPTELMRYLCRLVTPKGGLIVDPFAGSGSTGKAATQEGFKFLGFELDHDYALLASSRLASLGGSQG